MSFLKAYIPSRNTSIFFGIIGSLVGCKQYDKYESKRIRDAQKLQVKPLAERPLLFTEMPDKYIIFLHTPEDYYEAFYKANEYFTAYIKPILDAAAVNYDVVIEKNGGEIQNYAYNEVKKLRGYKEKDSKENPNPVELPEYVSPVLGWVALGREAYGKVILGIQDGASVLDLDFDPIEKEVEELAEVEVQTLETLEQNKVKEQTKNETEVEKEKKVPASPNSLVSLLPEDQPRNMDIELPNNIPPLGYIRLHHYTGVKYAPLRIYEWFRDRDYIKTAGDETVAALTGKPKPLELPEDFVKMAQQDHRISSRKEVNPEFSTLVDEKLSSKLSIFVPNNNE